MDAADAKCYQKNMLDISQEPGLLVRLLLRNAAVARLATLLPPSGEPYASLVLLAVDQRARPLLLLSDLAEHTRNLAADSRCSLLVEEPEALDDPLVAARAGLQGSLAPVEDPRALARYVMRHPSAAAYAGFRDFHLYRMEPRRAHLVAGFGRIHWLDAGDVLLDDAEPLAEAEAGIVEHMNEDHADAIDLIAARLLRLPAGGWKMTGVDPEGADLRRGGERARIPFPVKVEDAAGCRQAAGR